MRYYKNYSLLSIIGLSTVLLIGTILNAINVFSLLFFGTLDESTGTILKFVSIAIIGFSLFSIFKKSYLLILISLLFFGTLWYLAARNNPATIPFINENIQSFFFECLPYLWFFYYFSSRQSGSQELSLFNILYKICKVKLIIAIILQIIMFVEPQTDIFHDYMDASFAILFGLVFITSSNLKNHHTKPFDVLLEIIGLSFVFALGSRGSILCYGSVYVLYFFFIKRGNKIRSVFLLSLIILVFYIAWPSFLASTSGSQNRLLSMLSSSSLVVDENRNMLYLLLGENIFNNPLGMGVMSDRVIISEAFPSLKAYYAHNILLELAIDFGYLGIAAFIGLLFFIVRSLIKDEQNKYTLTALVSGSLVKLMVSTSLWIDPLIWGLLGVLLGHYKLNKS